MKTPSIAIMSLALSLLLPACIATIPGNTSATEHSGTSPEFAPGTFWIIPVGFCGAGDIISWAWWTSDNLGFAVFSSPDMTFYYGFEAWDGYVISTPGDYYLLWSNDNLLSNATVSYAVLVFTPSLTIITPKYGAYLNSTTVSVQGTYDGYADGVLVGPDELHLRKASISGTSWAADALALNEGKNTILVRSYYVLDYYGTKNNTLERIIQVNVDTVLPDLAILRPVQDSLSSGHVVASWQCSDDSGIATEEVEFDALGWQTAADSGYAIDLPNGVHSMQVRVTDLAGNQILKTVTFTLDSTLPDLVITSPTEGSYVNETAVVSWQTSDNYGITKEELRLDSLSWETAQSGLLFGGFEGKHAVSVRVTDLAGNQVEERVNFTKDVNPPILTALTPASGSFVAGSAHVSWSCSDNFGVGKREVRVDSSSWREVMGDETVVEVANGPHTIEVRVTDLAGNIMVQETSVVGDTVVPQVAIVGPDMNAKITRDSVVVSWNGADDLSGIDHYEVQITGGQWFDVGTSTSFEFTDLENVWYFVTVKAVDRSGNSAISTVHFGIYASIWSQNGPYYGIPNLAVSAVVVAGAIISILFYWHKRRAHAVLPAQEPPSEAQYYPPRKEP